ncbi:MAG: hypothetical protein NC110_05770 [Ruminococcus sp.]|nr:hypothetical protein [Ruminococcus sp.]
MNHKQSDYYKAFFKCRLCGRTFYNTGTPDRNLVINDTAKLCVGAETSLQFPTLTDVHICADENIGIADLIGWRKDKSE